MADQKSSGKSSNNNVPGSKTAAATVNDAAFDTAARGAVPLDAIDRTFELLDFRGTRLNTPAVASVGSKSIVAPAPAALQKNMPASATSRNKRSPHTRVEVAISQADLTLLRRRRRLSPRRLPFRLCFCRC